MTPFFLIAGLGNPGDQYRGTRHNVGFDIVDKLKDQLEVGLNFEKKFNANLGQTVSGEKKVLLCQPMTFMNLSGDAVTAVKRFYKIPLKQILVVSDDLDLGLGTIRMRPEGSSGGQRGLQSIEQRLGTQRFSRQRIGIGRPDNGMKSSDYVLGKFREEERELYALVVDQAADQIICWLNENVETAMTRFNGTINKKKDEQ